MRITYQLINLPDYVQATVEGDTRIYLIPNDQNNKDWREYQEWLALGNKPEPTPSVPVPQAPTVESLMAELAVLKAKIEAL
jgi:hypothetical protein